jgi:hypothetical protein
MSTIQISVSFEELAQAALHLPFEERLRLWRLLREQIEADEDAWENSPKILAEVREARMAYEAGDYMTIEEYAEQQS